MIPKPIFIFDDTTSTGIDQVPVNSVIRIKADTDGKVKHIILVDKSGITGASTISNLLNDPSLYNSYYEDIKNAVGKLSNPILSIPFKNSLAMVHGVGDVTFQRDTTGTYIDRYGVLQTAAIDEPRFEKEGLLIETASTNIMLQSEDIASATWLKTGVTATSSTILTCTTAYNEHHIYQNLPVVTGTQYTHSVTIKRGTHKYIRLTLYLHSYVTIDTTDFSVFATSSPDFYGVEILNDDTARIYVTNTSTVTSGGLSCLFSFIDTNGTSDFFTGTGQTVEILNSQFEVKKYPTSFIPTTTIAVERKKDICKLDIEGNIPIWGNTFSVAADVDFHGLTSTVNRFILYDGSTQNGYLNMNTGGNYAFNTLGGTPLNATHANTNVHRVVYSADGVNQNFYLDGVQKEEKAIGSNTWIPKTVMYIGGNGTSQLDGHISNLRIWDKYFTKAEAMMV